MDKIDNVIRHEWAEKSKDVLVNDHGKNIEWHSYPNLDHSADPQEINHLQMWLEKRIPPPDEISVIANGDAAFPEDSSRLNHEEIIVLWSQTSDSSSEISNNSARTVSIASHHLSVFPL